MIVPDANLLVFAHDAASPHHSTARRWWTAALEGPEPIGIPWVVVLAFVRLTTHPSVCADPLTPAEAREFVDFWLAQPRVTLLVPGAETLRHWFEFMEESRCGGNLSTDALIAAQAFEHGGTVFSHDRDFARFSRIRWRNPLA